MRASSCEAPIRVEPSERKTESEEVVAKGERRKEKGEGEREKERRPSQS